MGDMFQTGVTYDNFVLLEINLAQHKAVVVAVY
jgi:hypothetical protein